MQLILITLFLLLILFNRTVYLHNKLYKTILFIISSWWILCLLLTIYKNNNLYPVSNITIMMFILSIISLNIGFFIMHKIANPRKSDNNRTTNDDIFVSSSGNYKSKAIITIVMLLLLIINIYYLVRYNNILSLHDISYARIIRFELGYLLRTPLELIIYNYVISSLITIIALTIPYLTLKKKYRNPIVLLGIPILIMNAQIGKGRMIIFEFFMYFIITFIILNFEDLKNQIKKNIIIVMLLLLSSILILVIITLNRFDTDFSNFNQVFENLNLTVKQVQIYFTGSVRTFEYSIIHNYRDKITAEYGNSYGAATFSGINEFFIMIVRGLGAEIKTLNMVISQYTNPPIFIGDHVQYNAFYSMLFNFHIDFGVFGIFIFSLLFGFILHNFITWYLNEKCMYTLLILVYTVYILLFGFLRWELQSPSTWLVFLLIIVVRLTRRLDKRSNVMK